MRFPVENCPHHCCAFGDYDKLFADRAADLTTRQFQNGQTVTDLRSEKTVVTRDLKGTYIGYATKGSAPGCYFEILISLHALAQTCPATFGKDRSDNLTAFSTYMTRNAYHP